MLRITSSTPEKKSQVLFNSGGVLDPDRTQTVLRSMFPNIHTKEKRLGQAVPSANRVCRPKTCMRKPNATKVYETEVEQNAAEEQDVPEVELFGRGR